MTTMTKATRKQRVARKRPEAPKVIIQVRLDAKTKNKAERIFKRLGMSSSDAIRIFFSQTVEEQGLPFQPHILDAESRLAIEESLSGGGEVITVDDLQRQWDET